MAKLDVLLSRLGIPYKSLSLYEQALTHPSYANEMNRQQFPHYERLEFLGDAIIQQLVSLYLYHHFNDLDEGRLSLFRSSLVREETLSSLAKQLGFGEFLRLGHGEERTGGKQKDSVLANAFEAFVAALFLDQGYVFVQQKITKLFEELIVSKPIEKWFDSKDPKTKLQELVQADQRKTITYTKIRTEGPANAPLFYVHAILDDIVLGAGSGNTVKEAEQEAARDALSKMATPK